jgi:hypothetical protein
MIVYMHQCDHLVWPLVALMLLGGCRHQSRESGRDGRIVDEFQSDMAPPALDLSTRLDGVGSAAPTWKMTEEPTTQNRSECADFGIQDSTCQDCDMRDAMNAIKKAQRAGKPQCAWRIIGIAACRNRDTKLANDAYRHVSDKDREFLVYVCKREYLHWVNGRFRYMEQ